MPAHVLLNKENEEAEAPSDPRFQMYQTMDRFLKRVRQVSRLLFRVTGSVY